MDLRVTVVGRTELERGLAQANRVAQEETRRVMLQALQLVQADARQLVKKDQGDLERSIRPFLIEQPNGLLGVLEPMQPYGLPVERGRNYGRAGSLPPFQPIQEWVSRHRDLRRSLIQQVFLVRRKIGTRGIAPTPFMLPAYTANRQRIIDLFAQIGHVVVTRIVRGT